MRASEALNQFLDAVGSHPTGWANRVKLRASKVMPNNPQAELILYRSALWGLYTILGEHILLEAMKALRLMEEHHRVEGELLSAAYARLDALRKELEG